MFEAKDHFDNFERVFIRAFFEIFFQTITVTFENSSKMVKHSNSICIANITSSRK